MADDHNKETKELLEKAFRQVLVEIADDSVSVPLLNRNTEQIVINCNAGHIIDIKPVLRLRLK